MLLSEPIVLWMESNHLAALSKALADPGPLWCGANMRRFMQDKLDRLYEVKVSPEERRRIDALCKAQDKGKGPYHTKGERPCTLCRIIERGEREMLAVFNSFDLLELARIVGSYRQGIFQMLKPVGLMDCLGEYRLAAPSEFAAAIDKRSWYDTPLAGVYCIDLDKSLLAVCSAPMDWTAYSLDGICTAARNVCGYYTGDITDPMRLTFQEELGRVEMLPYDPLESYTYRRI